MHTIAKLSVSQLKQALAIREKIDSLERELDEISGEVSATPVTPASAGRKTISPAHRAKIAASARARWARVRGTADAAAKPAKKVKGQLSAAGRAAIIAATKARWARWAKLNGTTLKPKAAQKVDRRMSPAVRAKLAAIARARWAKIRAAGKSRL